MRTPLADAIDHGGAVIPQPRSDIVAFGLTRIALGLPMNFGVADGARHRLTRIELQRASRGAETQGRVTTIGLRGQPARRVFDRLPHHGLRMMRQHRPLPIGQGSRERPCHLAPVLRRCLGTTDCRQHLALPGLAHALLHRTIGDALQRKDKILTGLLGEVRRIGGWLCRHRSLLACSNLDQGFTLSNQLRYTPRGLSLKPRTRSATSLRPTPK